MLDTIMINNDNYEHKEMMSNSYEGICLLFLRTQSVGNAFLGISGYGQFEMGVIVKISNCFIRQPCCSIFLSSLQELIRFQRTVSLDGTVLASEIMFHE